MMYSHYYKTGNIVIQVNTPEDYIDSDVYGRFLSECTEPDEIVYYSFSENFPSVDGKTFRPEENKTVVVNEKIKAVYYFGGLNGEKSDICYACSVWERGSKLTNVYLSEFLRENMRASLIFRTMNFESICLRNHALIIHSSFIISDGNGILFTAPKETGKSTQAFLWNKYRNAFTVNGDKALIFFDGDKCNAGGIPFSGTSGICFNRIVPILSIVSLSQGKDNIIEKLSGVKAFSALFRNICSDNSDEDECGDVSAIINDIISSVPVFSFSCTPDENAVYALENKLKETI